MYKPLNKNPKFRITNDCVIRAIAKALDMEWDEAFDEISDEAKEKYDTMDANHVWIGWLKKQGFRLYPIPNTCPDCYTIRDFCMDHPWGTYILGTGTHVVTVINGNWFDSFDSGDLIPTFFLRRV